MELLGYTHAALDYEDPTPSPELRPLADFKLPNAAWINLTALIVATTILTTAHNAMALVQRGDRGSSVSAVQSALVNRGYTVAVDGVYGPQTEAAVLRFQRNQNLQQDGVVGPATAGRLGVSSSSGSVTPVTSGTSGNYIVGTGAGVLIRSGPGLGYGVISSAGSGATLSLTSNRVLANGYTWGRLVGGGWVATDFLYRGTAGPITPPGGSGYRTVLAGSGLVIRSGPGLGYGQIGGLGYGQRVYITGERASGSGYTWARLSGGGWVATSFLGY